MTSTQPVDRGSLRRDPRYDGRRVVAFAVGLLVVYVGAVVVLRPGPADLVEVAIPAMFAPTVGAVAAVVLAHGRVILGRPTWHLLLAFLPPLVILVTTGVVSAVGAVEVHPGRLGTLLLLSPVLALAGSLTAVGEEVGWRGFLWPLLRGRWGFWWSATVMVPVWWLYHLPAILWWGYGFLAGLPAFTVAIVGFILFVGVLTERSRGIWASVLAHGAWNGIVAAGFVAALGAHHPTCGTTGCAPFSDEAQLFTGPQTLLGEFGWIAAVTMLVLGVLAARWHLRHPVAVATG